VVKVSVIIAAYNAADTLPRAVQSCLEQTDVTVEVVIANDASTDNTTTVAAALAAKHPEVKVVNLVENGGPSAARNAGFDAATGDWLAVLDADDTMAPDRLAHMVSVADAENADAVYDNLKIMNLSAPDATPPNFLSLATFGESARWDLPFFVANNQARPGKPALGYLKPLFRAAFLREHNLRYTPKLRNGEDFHLMLEALCCDAALHYTPLAKYHYTTGGPSISNPLNLDHAAALINEASDFIERNTGKISPDVVAGMRVRRTRLQDFASAEKAMRDLKAKRFGGALLTFGKRPRALFRFTQQLTQALSKRLSG